MNKIKYLLIIMLFVFIGCSSEKTSDNNNEIQVKIAIIGDSISAGCNPDISEYKENYEKRYGWVDMLNGSKYSGVSHSIKPITTIYKNSIIANYSIIGSKASEWSNDYSENSSWKEWDNEFKKVVNFNPDIVIIYLGGNDFLEYLEDGVITELEWKELENSLRDIITKLKLNNENTKIYLLGYYDLFDTVSSGLKSMSSFAIYQDFSKYTIEGNNIIKKISTDENIIYLDVYDEFMGHCYGRYLGGEDKKNPMYFKSSILNFDIHPVTNGHEKIAEIVYNGLISNKDK